MKKLLPVIFFLLLTDFALAQYKNLVFEGGGTRGLAYAGAVFSLEQKGVLQHIEKVGGTSAGSIIALMLSMGYTSKEIDSIMFELKIQRFNDGNGGLVGKYKRAKKYYGIHKGDVFEEWLEELIGKKTNNPFFTFAQLDSLCRQNKNFRQFACVGTNLSKQRSETFSFATSPNMQLKTAVRISCSIPFFYEPVLIDSVGNEIKERVKGYNYQVYADGGILANYPVNIFDSCKNLGNPLFCDSIFFNKETLGFKLDRKEQVDQYASSTDITPYNIQTLKEYGAAFFNLVMETMNRKGTLMNEKGRTIYIPYSDLFSNPKKVSEAEKKEMYESGKKATDDFLSTHKLFLNTN
jgi:NTE family protein